MYFKLNTKSHNLHKDWSSLKAFFAFNGALNTTINAATTY